MIRSARILAPSLALAAFLPSQARGQLPGIPTLQNAWANPGITAAANIGSGRGSRAAALAGAWAPASGRFQVSGGIGMRDSEVGGRGMAFGARAAVPFRSFAGGAFGVAGFAGIGSAREPDALLGLTGDKGGTLTQVPIGAAVGYRRAFGFIRGLSVYGAPFYLYNRMTVGDTSVSAGAFRFSVGADAGITSRIGVTVGAEFGASAGIGEPGPSGAVYGLGASFALGRRE